MEANETPFWMEARRWKIDWQLNWSAVSVTWLAFFFFHVDSQFFCLDSNFKISNRVCSHDICLVFFRSWTYILQISTHVFYCIRCILQVSTYVLCFQHVFTIGIILSLTERHTKFTPLSETTSIPTIFICGVPPPSTRPRSRAFKNYFVRFLGRLFISGDKNYCKFYSKQYLLPVVSPHG